MNSPRSRARNSFSEMQPFCEIIKVAHSVFQMRSAVSVSDGSILMGMRRMIDMASSGTNDGVEQKGGIIGDGLRIGYDIIQAVAERIEVRQFRAFDQLVG